jgi:glycosyltransferase involved in cell wall biosynthesis
MKICIIGNDWKQQFPLLGYGGIESSVEHLCNGLSDHYPDIEFDVIAPKRLHRGFEKYDFNIIETEYIESSSSGIPSHYFAHEASEIIRNLKKKPNIIWSYGSWSPSPLLSLNIPIICTIMDSGGWENNKFIHHHNVYYRFSSKFIFDEVFKNCENNQDIKNIMGQSFWCHTGVCEKDFIPPKYNRDNYILWVAGLNWGVHSKGLDMFIELSKMLPDEKFKAYGSGNDELSQNLMNLNLPNFEFLGELKRGNAHNEAFMNAKMFAMFTKIPEAFGRTTVESITKGTPVLGTLYGATPELINSPELGFCSNDINKLCQYIKNNPVVDHGKCYEKSKKFHISTEISRLLKVSENIIPQQ